MTAKIRSIEPGQCATSACSSRQKDVPVVDPNQLAIDIGTDVGA